jgi:hypothetical protein
VNINTKDSQTLSKAVGRALKLLNKASFNNGIVKHYTMWTCDKVCRALSFLLDNIYVRFGNTLFKQIIEIPMGTNCAPLVADLFLYCYERDFMLSLSEDK